MESAIEKQLLVLRSELKDVSERFSITYENGKFTLIDNSVLDDNEEFSAHDYSAMLHFINGFVLGRNTLG